MSLNFPSRMSCLSWRTESLLEYNLFIPLGRPRQDDKFRYSMVGQFFNNLVKGLRLAEVLHMFSFLITVSGAASIRASNALLIVLVPEVPLTSSSFNPLAHFLTISSRPSEELATALHPATTSFSMSQVGNRIKQDSVTC